MIMYDVFEYHFNTSDQRKPQGYIYFKYTTGTGIYHDYPIAMLVLEVRGFLLSFNLNWHTGIKQSMIKVSITECDCGFHMTDIIHTFCSFKLNPQYNLVDLYKWGGMRL